MSVVDTFTFFNELDVLALRLAILTDVVDRFVLVEATETFTGIPKSLNFLEHRDDPRFAPYRDRITHVIVNDLPRGTPWQREFAQRNAIRRGLADCHDTDLILISDVDEIPRPRSILEARSIGTQHRGESIAFRQTLYGYTLNWRHVRPWFGTRAMLYGDIEQPNDYRRTQGPRYERESVIPDAGWSFSWFGGVASIQAKARAYSHVHVANAPNMEPAHIAECIQQGQPLVSGEVGEYVWADIDDTYPGLITADPDRYAALGWFSMQGAAR
jgi:Glycosyltransferase family 17